MPKCRCEKTYLRCGYRTEHIKCSNKTGSYTVRKTFKWCSKHRNHDCWAWNAEKIAVMREKGEKNGKSD